MSTVESPADEATTDASEHEIKDPGSALNARRVRMPGYKDTSVGPFTQLAAERARLGALTWEHFDIKRVGATIGAELHGVDIVDDPAPEVIAEIRQALTEYKVIFFRDQPLTAEAHIRFARQFGELETHPFLPGSGEHPELVRFAKGADTGGYENGWHHDVTWRAEPSMGAILHAIEVPECGGDTLFCDMNAAYEGLEPGLKDEVESMTAVHDYLRAFGQQVEPGKEAEMRKEYPQVEHPVICAHPVSGKKLLYVNRYFTDHLVGLEAAESFAMLDRLCKQADTLEYQCRFQWEADSVAFWDNRAVQHYAASDYFPDVRVMERASITGPRPVAA